MKILSNRTKRIAIIRAAFVLAELVRPMEGYSFGQWKAVQRAKFRFIRHVCQSIST